MPTTKYSLNRYFWGINITTWMAVHAFFTHIQYNAVKDTDKSLGWLNTFIALIPWFWLWIAVTAGVFWFVMTNRDYNKNKAIRVCHHLTTMLILLLAYWSLATLIQGFMRGNPLSDFPGNLWRILVSTSYLDVFIYLGVLACALTLRFYHVTLQERMELKRLNSELIQEQLKTLRSQLNPHFLFNTLNTIASLVRLKREKDAVTALSELSMMLRKILENKNHNEIKVKDEIAFIKSYLAIQKMRFAEKLDSHITVQSECLEISIPNMLLHPLVENAVQHGSQLESNANPLNLDIRIEDGQLMFLLTNRVAKQDNHQGFGIGLDNTRNRLARLYSQFILDLRPINNDLFETRLAIPIGGPDA